MNQVEVEKEILIALIKTDAPLMSFFNFLRHTPTASYRLILEAYRHLIETQKARDALDKYLEDFEPEIKEHHYLGVGSIERIHQHDYVKSNAMMEWRETHFSEWNDILVKVGEYLNASGSVNLVTEEQNSLVFKTSSKEVAKKLREELINHSLIDHETSIREMTAIFGFGPKTKIVPVRWTGSNFQLQQLIQSLVRRGTVKVVPKRMWETASNCFVDQKGNQLDRMRIQGARPSNSDKERITETMNKILSSIQEP